MLTAKYHPLGKLFWDIYIHRIIRNDFSRLVWETEDGFAPAADRAMLVMANHCSWWDGFWVYELNRRFLGKRFHVMMLEQELRPRQFLRYAGAFSIHRGQPRSMLETLAYAAGLLADSRNMVLMFPQGRIESMYCSDPTFEQGIWRMLQQVAAPVQLVSCMNAVDYMAERKPTLTMHLAECEVPQDKEALEAFFRMRYGEARRQQGARFA